MSKEGPPANSFTEPRLTGFLTKQGGQGITTNWRHRYFVLDNHYLFYYKSKKDSKPVGVVCLSDYKSCQKALPKESKKNKHTFVIEKGDHTDEVEYTVRNYYIYAETETEMKNWIDAINIELQPFETGQLKKGPKVDIKAFDELSTTVDIAVKLSHPTAARPKPQGRRPPRKYTPFHEDDIKEDNNLRPKRPMSQSSIDDYHTSSTTPTKSITSQSSEESIDTPPPKRGHQPAIPLKPTVTKDEETSNEQDKPVTPLATPTFKVPTPPPSSAKPKGSLLVKGVSPTPPPDDRKPPPDDRKPSSDDMKPSSDDRKPSSDDRKPSSDDRKPSSDDRKPSSDDRIPSAEDKKPSSDDRKPSSEDRKPSSEDRKQSLHDEQPLVNELIKTKPLLPSSKPAPPPPTKPKNKRSNTDISIQPTGNTILPPGNNVAGNTIPPQGNNVAGSIIKEEDNMKTDDSRSELPLPGNNNRRTNSITTEKKFNKPRPPTKLRKGQSLTTTSDETTIPTTTDKPKPKPRTKLSKDDLTIRSIDNTIQDNNEKENSIKDIEQDIEEVTLSIGNPTIEKINYENVTLNVKQDGQLTLTAPDDKGEQQQEQQQQEQQQQQQEKEHEQEEQQQEKEQEQQQDLQPVNNEITETLPASNEELVEPKENTVTTEGIYDTPKSSPLPTATVNNEIVYDVPNPVNNTTLCHYDTPTSPTKSTSPPPPVSQTTPTVVPGRLSLIEPDYDIPSTFGVTSSVTSPTNNDVIKQTNEEETYVPPERDAWGYALVNKKQSIKLTNNQQQQQRQEILNDLLAAHIQTPEDITNVPENLLKAKEILRLAMVVKAEVLEMRNEVESELALARRERHDSQVMKQNAAEILKMAKDVLQRVSSS